MARGYMTAALLATVALTGCSKPQDNQTAAAPADAATAAPAATTGVTREEVAPSAPPPTQIVAPAIQTQPGPRNTNVALNRVTVTGDILTVSTTFSAGNDCCIHIPVEEVAVIDDATSQRIGVLKDNQGKWMAAPLEYGGKNVGPESYKSPSVVWFKFPAPPATSKTVSIAIPGVAPFDAVPVTR